MNCHAERNPNTSNRNQRRKKWLNWCNFQWMPDPRARAHDEWTTFNTAPMLKRQYSFGINYRWENRCLVNGTSTLYAVRVAQLWQRHVGTYFVFTAFLCTIRLCRQRDWDIEAEREREIIWKINLDSIILLAKLDTSPEIYIHKYKNELRQNGNLTDLRKWMWLFLFCFLCGR